MTQIIRSVDCGNSPKNQMVEDLAVAFESGDSGSLSSVLEQAARWNCAAFELVTAETILASVRAQPKPDEVFIDRVMSHGKVGAVNGVSRRGGAERRFCYVFAFSSVKCQRLSRIESY